MRSWSLVAVALVFITVAGSAPAIARNENAAEAVREIPFSALPREAQTTLQAIKRGGPFAFERDDAVFGNYEHRLPARNRGYYREYTVTTPGVKNRGARRIVSGRDGEYYYSDDHYRNFKRIRE